MIQPPEREQHHDNKNEQLLDFLFWSFYFSEGGLELQKAFLDEHFKGQNLHLSELEQMDLKTAIVERMVKEHEFMTSLHGEGFLTVDPKLIATGVSMTSLLVGKWYAALTNLVDHFDHIPYSTDENIQFQLGLAADQLLMRDTAHIEKVKSGQSKNVRMLGEGDQRLANSFFLRYGLRAGRTRYQAITDTYRKITEMLHLPDNQLEYDLIATRRAFAVAVLTNRSRFREQDFSELCEWIQKTHIIDS